MAAQLKISSTLCGYKNTSWEFTKSNNREEQMMKESQMNVQALILKMIMINKGANRNIWKRVLITCCSVRDLRLYHAQAGFCFTREQTHHITFEFGLTMATFAHLFPVHALSYGLRIRCIIYTPLRPPSPCTHKKRYPSMTSFCIWYWVTTSGDLQFDVLLHYQSSQYHSTPLW